MKSVKLFFVIVLMAVFGGCTQNNGHIGKLFGSWGLELMTVDDQPVVFEDGGFATMSFQSNIVMAIYNDKYHNSLKSYGTWKRFDSVLQFDFEHKSNNDIPGTGAFAPPVWLQFPAGVSDFVIVELSDSKLWLMRTDDNGKQYVYIFKKTW